MENLGSLLAMVISDLLIIGIIIMLKKQREKTQLRQAFLLLLVFMFIWTFGSILQILFQNYPIDPFLFEKFAGIGVWFSPVAFLAVGIIFAKTKLDIKWYHYLLLIIPITTAILSFTNEYHHLVFVKYSPNVKEMVYGPYFMVHTIYTYLLFGIGLLYFIRYSIKNSGFFSKQSILIIISTLIPIVINLLATLHVMPMTTYSTPISFTFMVLIFALAIFKFDFMKVTPIALQRIVDRMSDGYLVINEKDIIIDFNQTFLKMFSQDAINVRNKNLFSLIEEQKTFQFPITNLKESIEKTRTSDETLLFENKLCENKKYFNIEINGIRNKNSYLGTLILFKDTTQHVLDMKTIRDNQNMLMERERLASLGQLIGGIAHNLKTPIMSISGATEGLHDLIQEYDASIGDPEVTNEDHHEIAKDMNSWITKIKSYTEYMSDIITAVKGQAVTLSSEQSSNFTVEELVKRVDILMKHELKNALITLNSYIQVDPKKVLNGSINSLVQVIDNMISNAIQAYDGKPNNDIDFIIKEENNQIIISIKDYGKGLDDEVKQKLFKEMITTKGKNGTGLGLFMSYSTIRAHFNGNITFESEKGKGTTFNIILPS